MNDASPHTLFEDNDIAVIDKPAGVIVNRADTTKNVQTLQDWVETNVRRQLTDSLTSDFYLRSGIVHRLDKETSGILLVAKNEKVFLELQKEFKDRVVKKTYLALVHGKVIPTEGEINVPVGRLPWDRKKFGVVVQGRESQTLYKVKEYLSLLDDKKSYEYSLLQAFPQTGRTHQIRVHFRYLGYPIAGDALYGGRKNIQLDKKYLNRHFLHAFKIKFIHPMTEEEVSFESPLPNELQQFLNRLHPINN